MTEFVAIFELGVIKNGLLLVKREYYEKFDYTIRKRHPQIIDGITKMASIILKDSVKFMKFDDLLVAVYSSLTLKNGSEEFMEQIPSDITIASYCIGDKSLIQDQIFPLLSRITQGFLQNYEDLLKNSSKIFNYDVFEEYGAEIDNLLKDIQYTPIDRLKMGIL